MSHRPQKLPALSERQNPEGVGDPRPERPPPVTAQILYKHNMQAS